MAVEIEKKTIWQEPYNNSESLLRAAYFGVGGNLFSYDQKENNFRLFRSPFTGNFLVQYKTGDCMTKLANFFPHQLLGVVTVKIHRLKL